MMQKNEVIDELMTEFCGALKAQKMSVATLTVELKALILQQVYLK